MLVFEKVAIGMVEHLPPCRVADVWDQADIHWHQGRHRTEIACGQLHMGISCNLGGTEELHIAALGLQPMYMSKAHFRPRHLVGAIKGKDPGRLSLVEALDNANVRCVANTSKLHNDLGASAAGGPLALAAEMHLVQLCPVKGQHSRIQRAACSDQKLCAVGLMLCPHLPVRPQGLDRGQEHAPLLRYALALTEPA